MSSYSDKTEDKEQTTGGAIQLTSQSLTNLPINLVITMAGRGSRFIAAGYKKPKYEIEVNGKTLFEWSLSSLKNFICPKTNFFFITLAENRSQNFITQKCRLLDIPNFEIKQLQEVSNGQATSVLAADKMWRLDHPLLIYNIDTFIDPASIHPNQIPNNVQGWLSCFSALGDHWSFVKIDGETGLATEIAEKKRISNLATTGLYWFSSASEYCRLYAKCYPGDKVDISGERYIAPMYQTLLEDGGKIAVSEISNKAVVGLGTPAEVDAFSRSRKSMGL